MKKNSLITIGILALAMTLFLSSCTKVELPSENDPIKITSVVQSSPQDHPNHVTKIRICLKNRTSNTIHYCRFTIRIVDDHNGQSHEVFYRTLEVGSKDNHNWTIEPYETQWSDWFATDFYIFGEGGYETRIDETLFY